MFVVAVMFRNMRQILNTCSWTEYEWNKKKREKLLQQKLSNTRRYETGNQQACVHIRKKSVLMNLLNAEKKGLQTSVPIRMKSVQMNLLNVERKGWQANAHIKKKSVQMNLLNVEKKGRIIVNYSAYWKLVR